jgi:cytochrome c553
MSKSNIFLFLFLGFAIGLPLWAINANQYSREGVHACVGECYEAWKDETGGIVAVAQAKALAKAEASPEELGKAAYIGCIACHGANGEGGIGPALAGQPPEELVAKLVQYKNGETRGTQSALMWSQASTLSSDDMNNIAAFVQSL